MMTKEELKKQALEVLGNKPPREKFSQIREMIFLLQMKDRWNDHDFKLSDVYHEIERELKEEIKNGTNPISKQS